MKKTLSDIIAITLIILAIGVLCVAYNSYEKAVACYKAKTTQLTLKK